MLARDERSPLASLASALAAIASTATQASAPPTLIRCAGGKDLRDDEAAVREHVDRPFDGAAEGRDLLDIGQTRRVEDVRSRGLVGTQSLDRVVEVGVAADVVLGPGGEGEQGRSPRSGLAVEAAEAEGEAADRSVPDAPRGRSLEAPGREKSVPLTDPHI